MEIKDEKLVLENEEDFVVGNSDEIIDYGKEDVK